MFPDLRANYIDTGKIFYVFKDFPITQLHPQAARAAQAAECAGEQDRYWDMHGQLFADQRQWDTTPEAADQSFARFAQTLGLDQTAFDQCLSEERYADEVQADFNEARSLGLNGTPNFVINGKLLVGAQPADVFSRVLDRELRSLGVN